MTTNKTALIFALLFLVFLLAPWNGIELFSINDNKFYTASLPDSVLKPLPSPGQLIETGVFLYNNESDEKENKIIAIEKSISLQDQLDEIAEKIDIIKSQIEDLSPKNPPQEFDNPEISLAQAPDPTPVLAPVAPAPEEKKDEIIKPPEASPQPVLASSGGRPDYPKILISEVQIMPVNKRFIELYNPNNFEVDLSEWYLQRKTKSAESWGSLVSSKNFEQKKIAQFGYFIVAREEYSNADIFLDDLTLGQDNSIALKDPNREISDKLGWGSANDPELLPTLAPDSGLTIGRKWILVEEQDTNDNSADFEIQFSTPRQQNLTYIAESPPAPSPTPEPAQTPEPTPELKDTTPPDIVFGNLNSSQENLSFQINFTITDLLGTVTPSGLASYVFRFKEEAGDWQEDLSCGITAGLNIFDTSRDFEGQDDKTYYFQAKALDLAGNDSGWLPENPLETKISRPKKVVINEIQVLPAKDRFIELYNPNDYEINLTGWYLQRKTKTAESWSSLVSSANFENKIIGAKSYFLIAREMAEADILLDDLTISLNNSLVFKNKSRQAVDMVGFGEALDFESSPAQNPETGQSIERIASGQDSDDNGADFKISSQPSPKNSLWARDTSGGL